MCERLTSSVPDHQRYHYTHYVVYGTSAPLDENPEWRKREPDVDRAPIELGEIISPDTPSNAFHLPNGTGEKAYLDMYLFVAFLSDAVNDSTRTHRRCTTEPDPDNLLSGGSWLYCVSIFYSFLGGHIDA